MAVAPLAELETRGRLLDRGLRDATAKLAELVNNSDAIESDQRRARLQVALGSALRLLGEREGRIDRLEQAVDAFRAALPQYTRERVPLGWAGIQNNLGNALLGLGQRGGDSTHLQEAADAYRAALEERTRERARLAWAATQNNLGLALRTQGEREPGIQRLEQAVRVFRASLQEGRIPDFRNSEPLAKPLVGRVFLPEAEGTDGQRGGTQRS